MTELLFSVDPGLRECGCALFEDGKLAKAAIIASPNRKGRDARAWVAMLDEIAAWLPRKPDKVAAEMMQIYEKSDKNVRNDDLLQLVGIVGGVIGLCLDATCTVYRPKVWKGNVKKRIHHQRIWSILDYEEQLVVTRYMKQRADKGMKSPETYLEACEFCTGDDYPNDLIHNVFDGIGIGLYALRRMK